MKYVKPLFCLEILLVFAICTRVYMKWDLPLYEPILIGTIAVALFYYFKFSGFKASNSGTTKRPSLRISTSSK
ncbi:hypothetical protein PVK73_06125 [Bacillus thuringiensis]